MSERKINHFQPLDATALRNQIADQIRNAILNGYLKSGDHLIESAIAEQLQLSRAPVREALSALEREGIIVYYPRRGYFVVEFTQKDIEEIYSLRLLLEIGALQRSIDLFTDADFEKMQEIVDTLGQGIEEGWEQSRISSLDLSFHELICKAANHSRLFSVWDRMRWQTWMLIGLTARTHKAQPRTPIQFHQQILDAIRDKDLSRAERLLRDHILDAQQRALRELELVENENQKENAPR